MMTLVSYDVSTVDKDGRSRLRKIAKVCQNYGQRVQNSVFEITADYGTFLKIKDSLLKIIDDKQDSLRIYYLGNNWQSHIEHFGAKETYNPEGYLFCNGEPEVILNILVGSPVKTMELGEI